ncbi:MAG: undecaprenyl-diphosphate phosphatase [Kiloniellaceae bacterium]
MTLLHILILALVQGITEFLPISSSGHLVIVWEMFDRAGWPLLERTQSDRLILDIAVHVGTLFAVCLYFWRDVGQMALGLLKLAVGQSTPGARLAFYVVIGTVPLVVVGYLFKDQIAQGLRDVRVVAWATIGFGVVLLLGDRLGMTVRRIEHMTAASAVVIGLAQVLALIPGTSRAGITMTAARFLGFERPEAARFSLLLAIPAILGAGTLAGLDLYRQGDVRLGLDALMAAVVAFAVALAAIALMLRWLRHAGFTPFVVYRLLLGAALLVWLT